MPRSARSYVAIRVLLIEDNASDVDRIAFALREAGRRFELASVDRLAAAEAHLATHDVDVILLDLNLPDASGLAALAKLCAAVSEEPIVVLTGLDDDALAIEALQRGAADYLVKDELDGALLGRSLVYAVERRRIEQQLAEAQRIAHVGSWDWNITEGHLHCSRELLRIYASPSGAPPATFESLVAAVHADDRDRVRAAQHEPGECVIEHRIVRPGGEVRLVRSVSDCSVDRAGRPVRIVGTAQDITGQKQIQEQLLISERMASIGTLAAGVGHEINNPFAIVLSNIDYVVAELTEAEAELRARPTVSFLKQATGRPITQADFCSDLLAALEDARSAGQRVRQIVRDLKLFSRGDDDVQELVDVPSVIDSTVRMAMNEIRHRARLERDFADVPPVLANASRLGQVFLNLLVNAAHAIDEGNAHVNEIRVATFVEGESVIISVRDTGAGIPPEMLGRIFDPFFTTKPIGVGTGLGLAICHRIIAKYGGVISATSEVGRGTEVRVRLPVCVASPKSKASEEPPPDRKTQGRASVLVIDDEEAIGTSIERILGRGHDVTITTDARVAFESIRGGARYDLILCDLMMPQWTGMDFYAELLTVAPEQAENIVFLTGGAFTERGRSFLEEVPNFSLEKPFDTNQLRTLLHERLRKRSSD